MIARLSVGALVLLSAACTTPVAPAPEPGAWPCSSLVQDAASRSYGLARYRDDQRAVMLFPAGPAMAQYEAETAHHRAEGARLLALLKANILYTDRLPPPEPLVLSSLNEPDVTARVAEADACVAGAAK